MMVSCKEATQLIEKKTMATLSLKEGLQLNFHVMMCKVCAAYRRQSRLIDAFFIAKNKPEKENEVIQNTELKERILSKM
jgi:hypothetical protein